jgi:hypothetical protein
LNSLATSINFSYGRQDCPIAGKANNNPIAGRDFQNKWSTQEQLLPTLQFIDAMRNAKSDPNGAKTMIDSLGGYGSQNYKDTLKRAGNLNDLITKGQ